MKSSRCVAFVAAVLANTVWLAGCGHTLKVAEPVQSNLENIGDRIPAQTIDLGKFTLEIKQSTVPPSFLIAHDTKVIYKESVKENDALSVVYAPFTGKVESVSDAISAQKKNALINVTGEADPNVIIQCTSSDGSIRYFIFSLGAHPEKIATIENGYNELKLDPLGSNKFEIRAVDYYPDWGADSIAPEILLQWNGTKFTLDTKSMKIAPVAEGKLKAMSAAIAEQFKLLANDDTTPPINLAPPLLARYIFGFYYGGQSKTGMLLYDMAWRSRQAGEN